MSENKVKIEEIARDRNSGNRRFKIEDERNSWKIEICEDGKCDPFFKIEGFKRYKIYVTNFVESEIRGKVSTRTSGQFKYNLLNDMNQWETKRINNLLGYVKSLLTPTGWKK